MKHPHWTWLATLGLMSGTAGSSRQRRARQSRPPERNGGADDDGSAEIASPYAGTLKLPWARVSRIESDGSGRVRIGSLAETTPHALDRVAALNPPPIHAGLIFKLKYAI